MAGDWPRPLSRALTSRRERRWDAAHERYQAALRSRIEHEEFAPDAMTDPAPPAEADTVALNEARNRIALARPSRPTWMGDRILAIDSRIFQHYGMDIASAWPRSWLLLPDGPRVDLQDVRSAFTTAARRAAWGVLYVLLGLWWWPAAVAGMVVYVGAWREGRPAVAGFAELVEASVDLHGRDLAAALGIDCQARLTREVGVEITRTLRKGT